ncbi:acyl-CoA thioesterase [Sporosarcina sp. CAU 1771]
MNANYIKDISRWASKFEFSVSVSVKFSETDMFGHLNNIVPFAYYEYARIEYFKHIGMINEWFDPKGMTIPVVADMQCDYLKQIFFDEKLDVYVMTEASGTSSADIHYMIKNEKGEIVLTGRGSVVQINRVTGKSEPWTENARAQINGELVK